MEFNIQTVELNWKLLSTAKNLEESKIADEFLRKFKVNNV